MKANFYFVSPVRAVPLGPCPHVLGRFVLVLSGSGLLPEGCRRCELPAVPGERRRCLWEGRRETAETGQVPAEFRARGAVPGRGRVPGTVLVCRAAPAWQPGGPGARLAPRAAAFGTGGDTTLPVCRVGTRGLCRQQSCGDALASAKLLFGFGVRYSSSRAASADLCGCKRSSSVGRPDGGLITGEGNGFGFVVCLLLLCLSARRSSSFPVCLEKRKGKPTAFGNSPRCWKSVFWDGSFPLIQQTCCLN